MTVREAAQTAVGVGHGLIAAIWLGAMVYSLAVVQPRAARFFAGDVVELERFLVGLASDQRHKVLGLIGALAASGAALVALEPDRTGVWLAVVATKTALLAAALAVFWHVSWRHWPRRVFADDAELPALQAALRRRAFALVALVGVATALGLTAR